MSQFFFHWRAPPISSPQPYPLLLRRDPDLLFLEPDLDLERDFLRRVVLLLRREADLLLLDLDLERDRLTFLRLDVLLLLDRERDLERDLDFDRLDLDRLTFLDLDRLDLDLLDLDLDLERDFLRRDLRFEPPPIFVSSLFI